MDPEMILITTPIRTGDVITQQERGEPNDELRVLDLAGVIVEQFTRSGPRSMRKLIVTHNLDREPDNDLEVAIGGYRLVIDDEAP